MYAEQVAGVSRFFAMDHIRSVTDVTDAASAAVGRYAFDPWGRRTAFAPADRDKKRVRSVVPVTVTLYIK